MSREWSDAEVEDVLESVLHCATEIEYRRTLATLAQRYEAGRPVREGHASVWDTKPIVRLLWGLALRVRPYTGQPEIPGQYAGSPRTFGDRLLVRWAANGASNESKEAPTPEYLALMLRRPVEEVEDMWRELGPARGRRSLFGGKPK